LIIIDEARIFKEIDEKNPASVSLNGPDGMLPQVQDMAIKISTKYGIYQHMFWQIPHGELVI